METAGSTPVWPLNINLNLREMNTLLGNEIDPLTRGLVYLCEYRYPKLVVVSELQFVDPYIALEAYANIPNPASQLARGKYP